MEGNEGVRLEYGKRIVVVVPDSRDYHFYITGPYKHRFVIMNLAKLRSMMEIPEKKWPDNVQTIILSKKISNAELLDYVEDLAKIKGVTDIRHIKRSPIIHKILQETQLLLRQSLMAAAG